MLQKLLVWINQISANEITISVAIFASVVAIIAMYPSWIDYLQKTHINRIFGADAYTEDEIKNAVRFYIEPDCSQMDPAGESDIRQAVLLRDKLFKNVNKFIDSGVVDKHLLVLADSGMGKTAFTLQYYWQNRKASWNNKKRIAIIPLGRKNAIDAINFKTNCFHARNSCSRSTPINVQRTKCNYRRNRYYNGSRYFQQYQLPNRLLYLFLPLKL